jgi:hypothetical protein
MLMDLNSMYIIPNSTIWPFVLISFFWTWGEGRGGPHWVLGSIEIS